MRLEKNKVVRGEWMKILGAKPASLSAVWVEVGGERIAAYVEGDALLVKIPEDMDTGSVVVAVHGDRIGVVAIQ